MRGAACNAREHCLRKHGGRSGSVPGNVEMTGGTATKISFKEKSCQPMSVNSAGQDSYHTRLQNTVPEHVSTHQGDHNQQRRKAAVFIANSYCSSAGFNVQTQGGYIQTQGYIVKRKGLLAFDH